jgi:Regulator of ribonuclease activity B
MAKPAHVDRDALVRSVLAERGDGGETPRNTLFFFYGGDFEGLGAAALGAGYQVWPTVQRDGVVIATVTGVDESTFDVHSQRMEGWAEEFGCEYDGWECQLMTQ